MCFQLLYSNNTGEENKQAEYTSAVVEGPSQGGLLDPGHIAEIQHL